ncbi:MAG: DUF2076 domain-containing protein [Proteobacteria bacterium]|nr:MAG: DUF2076 domain-containing protein [Pseudomonadota bacterium]
MTPQERQLIDDLFDRLASVEGNPRDPQAMAAIAEGLRLAPNAAYALVQTVLVQDEALARASERIEQLERGGETAPAASGGFLDTMRDALFGQERPRRGGSVPPSGGGPDRPAWNSGAVLDRTQPQMPPEARPAGGGAGSFLGTAAAAAAGVVGGSLLMTGIRDLMGGGEKGQSLASDSAGNRGGPWGGSDAGKGDLARDAGLDDVGSNGRGSEQRTAEAGHDDARDEGRFDHADYEDAGYDEDDDFDDGDFDIGDSDFA